MGDPALLFRSGAVTARQHSFRLLGICVTLLPIGHHACRPLLQTCFLPGHYRHPQNIQTYPSSRSAEAQLPFSFPSIGTLSEEPLPTNSVFWLSLHKDLLHKTLIRFSSNVTLTKFWNVPPFCLYPSYSNDRTICFVFHYNLAYENILFHVNINKGRFDLTQKFQIKKGNFKIQEGNLLLCAKTY